MRLQLLRFDGSLELGNGKVSAMEVDNRQLYTRIVQSFLSEQGREAIEPYQLWNDAEKAVNPKKSMIVLNTLPEIPFDNKTLLSKLYVRVARSVEDDCELEQRICSLGSELLRLMEECGLMCWGTYSFGQAWNVEQFLKSFGFGPSCNVCGSLLENCINYFGVCADVDQKTPIVLVNGKTFFDSEELEELYSQAVFLGIHLLLLDSQHDSEQYEQERKMAIDQDFLVSLSG